MWLGWAGFPAAALLPLAIGFVGFLVFIAWLLAVSAALAFRRLGTCQRPARVMLNDPRALSV
jgi:hypothetical protein